jgi:hypothetical protein
VLQTSEDESLIERARWRLKDIKRRLNQTGLLRFPV